MLLHCRPFPEQSADQCTVPFPTGRANHVGSTPPLFREKGDGVGTAYLVAPRVNCRNHNYLLRYFHFLVSVFVLLTI